MFQTFNDLLYILFKSYVSLHECLYTTVDNNLSHFFIPWVSNTPKIHIAFCCTTHSPGSLWFYISLSIDSPYVHIAKEISWGAFAIFYNDQKRKKTLSAGGDKRFKKIKIKDMNKFGAVSTKELGVHLLPGTGGKNSYHQGDPALC